MLPTAPWFRTSLPGVLLALLTAFPALAPRARAQAPAPAPSPRQTLVRITDGLVSPLTLTSLDDQRLLVADQIGLVHVLDAQGSRRPEPFFDIRPKLTRLNQGFDERGLLGFALHPGFKENRLVYAYYSAVRRASCPTNWDHTSHISEFSVTPDLVRVDLASERLLLQIDQPYFNHNGGRLAFGPEGCLYVGVGDGGNANDQGFDRGPGGNAQDLTTLLGKFLRLDVDRRSPPLPYAVPADNPFLGKPPARAEIFAWGIRNPWGISFDRAGRRELFAADVGQGRHEEVNIIRLGANYGWSQREGRHPFDPKQANEPKSATAPAPSDPAEFAGPILEYPNYNTFRDDPEAYGISVTGGFVYRGRALPHLEGQYVFGDWSRQFGVADGHLLVASRPEGDLPGPWKTRRLPVASHPDHKLGMYVLSFGEDAAGELYVLTSQRGGLVDRTGAVWKLVPAPAAP